MKESTRRTIVNVAQKVFADRGLNKTTMEQVAKASGLGRRTLYLYFKTREELYLSVVKEEIDTILGEMEKIVNESLSPEKKLIHFVSLHMQAVEQLVNRNRTLRVDFLQQNQRIETQREHLDQKEQAFLTSILAEGNASNTFYCPTPEHTALIAHTTLKGLEVHFIKNSFNEECRTILKNCYSILFTGIKKQ